jgi:hypothetical protein
MNETLTNEEKQLLRNILLIFAAMAGMLGFFLLVAIVVSQTIGPLAPELNVYHNWLLGGVAAISFTCMLLAKRHLQRQTESAKTSPNPLSGKLEKYRSAFIVYMALSEFPVLLCITFSLLTGNFVFQVFAAVLLGYLLAGMPKKEKVLSHLL